MNVVTVARAGSSLFFIKNQQALYQRTISVDERGNRMYDHGPGAANLRTPLKD